MPIEISQPPLAADETTMLRSFLNAFRATIRRQAEGLTDAQLRQTLAPSPLTLGGMLSHLAFVEDYWFTYVLAGQPASSPWAEVDWESDNDWDWHLAERTTGADLDALLINAIAHSDRILDAALAAGGLDQRATRERGDGREAPTLRWILVHLVEEYARHAGHADLIRESIDGATDL